MGNTIVHFVKLGATHILHEKVLSIPIPLNVLQKYAILSPVLSAILFLVKTVEV